ncbi:transposase [Planobispora siamensis]|uniref:Tc1-like transposase DDE domain-containing protein n=1 Tax=Planobispora siamensis TaxID=936338 RepID=A0A8J3WJ31_9ACTN|nr:transposase [Planobispora siamensis]GIH91070.1 hypothetical protein Psi01_17000 [Planobispora siamensis]
MVAHVQLAAPIVPVWDNLNVHHDKRLQAFIDTCDRLTVFYLPTYAPDLNPIETIWSLLRRSSQANRHFTDPDQLLSVLRRGLRKIQYRSDRINGCLTATGPILRTSRPKPR